MIREKLYLLKWVRCTVDNKTVWMEQITPKNITQINARHINGRDLMNNRSRGVQLVRQIFFS